jgi:uncharacterized membrane protein
METYLRPLTLGEILDRTAQLYRANFLLFAGIASVYAGTLLILGLLQIGLAELLRIQHMTDRLQWLTLAVAGVELFAMFLLAGISVAANNRAVAWVHLGESATIRAAYAGVLPRAGRYLWLMTIAFVVVWLPLALVYFGFFGMILFYLPKGFMAHPDASNQKAMLVFGIASLVSVLLIVPAAIYTILMGLRYALAVPACVVENLPARAALRRSIQLSKGSRGRIFVLGLLVGIIEFGLVAITQSFFIIVAIKSHQQLPAGLRALQQLVGFVTNSFIGPMYATGLTLFYYDQRIRKEGYDIEWMMQAAGLTPPVPAPAQPAEAQEPWLALDAHFEQPTPQPPAQPAGQTTPDAEAPETAVAQGAENQGSQALGSAHD